MSTLILIPARYASTRFPGKPLADIGGQTMIERVYRRCLRSKAALVAIATDDTRIAQEAQRVGALVCMTSPEHPSGTDRIGEAFAQLQRAQRIDGIRWVVNVQGDEPFIQPAQIDQVIEALEANPAADIATLVQPLTDPAALHNPNAVKAVLGVRDTNGLASALYFSRHPIPYLRGVAPEQWHLHHRYFKHIGLYGFRAEVLPQLLGLPPSALERAESLEQLRWLENGYRIVAAETQHPTLGVDTPEDLAEILKRPIHEL